MSGGKAADDSQTSKAIAEDEEMILERHHPIYFAYGEPLSKLSLSFKTPIFRKTQIYFAYSQIMFWALSEKSRPFRDLSYSPELFYRWSLKDSGALKAIDFGVWSHLSNGKKEADSRSLDKQYVRFVFEREGHKWLTRFGLQLSAMHNFDPLNRDIMDYMGPLSLSVSFVQLMDSWLDKSEFSIQATPGGKFSGDWWKGGYQLSWSFRLGKLALVPSFYMQYYSGYAETLLNYDQNVSEFRGGFIF